VTVAELGQMIRAAGKAQSETKAPGAGVGLSGGPAAAREEPLGIPTGGAALAPGALESDLGGGLTYGSQVDPERARRWADRPCPARSAPRNARPSAS